MKIVNPLIVISLLFVCLTTQGQNFHGAACQGILSKLDSLMTDTTNINVLDKSGRSLLHYAVMCQQEEVFNYLIDRGIDINIEEKNGMTPLLRAVVRNRTIFIERLLAMDAKANFNRSNKEGTTVLMEAILDDNLPTVKLLIENGADLNMANQRGNTPLGIARREGLNHLVDLLIAQGASNEGTPPIEPTGEYMGESKPGLVATVFAPNFISTESFVHNGVFHPNGKEFYFTIETKRYHRGTIMVSKMIDGKWSTPEPAPIPGDFREVGPFISKDGAKFYYASNRPLNENESPMQSMDMWVMEREGDRWGKPMHLGKKVNTDGNDWFPTIADNGAIYYYTHKGRSGSIYYAERDGDKYNDGVLIEGVGNEEYYNYDPFIAPDESYLIFASNNRPDGLGSSDLYISFKDEGNKWSEPKNMGESINTSESEYAPLLTPDGKYFFFARGYGDVYWVSARIIESLR